MERDLSNFRFIVSTVFDTVPNFPLSGIADFLSDWSLSSVLFPRGSYVDILFLKSHRGMARVVEE